ncbi:hypothetical protein DYB32_009484 [Aphanomyces invadans]|uniref:EF-hand domain-containing protein n=1 Tax=Aphanomyces invadans TaxID=157072 RepID=A0A3R6ZIF9_9STRA|nr:hypothetical protein DYB32_009484 [Aphanomyces invadans]
MPDNNSADAVFNQLNKLGHGKLPLATLHQDFNAMAADKSVPSIDIKVCHIRSLSWRDGLVILDRFLASLRDCSERRSMRHGFVTPFDSPPFAKGVGLLVAELKRQARTLDGKYDYTVPFNVLDKERAQSIRLADFETGMREMGIGKYLNEQEMKSIVRRFDVDGTGGIDFNEFCRFVTTDHGDSAAGDHPHVISAIKDAFVQLPPYGVVSFANMIKRMCSMADKEGTGTVSATKFEQIFNTLDIALPRASKTDRPYLVELLCDNSDDVPYGSFCDLYVSAMTTEPAKRTDLDKETQTMLADAFNEMTRAADDVAKSGGAAFDYERALAAFEKGVTPADLKQVLWAAGVRYPFSPEELVVLHRAFQTDMGKFDVVKFGEYSARGPTALASPDPAGKLDAVVAHLQDRIQQLVSNDKDASRFHKLFLDFDANHDGSISTDEFLVVLDQMGLSKGLTAAEKASIVHFFDVNGDRAIDYTEFFHFANHADSMLQSKVDTSKAAIPVDASPPTAPGTGLPSAPSSPIKSTGGSAPASPAKPTTKSPSKDNILALQHPNGNVTLLGKQLFRVADLNRKLPRHGGFAFAKYFEKHKARHDASVLPWKKFRRILDKFLDTVLDAEKPTKAAARDVARVDVSFLEMQYIVRETGMVKYPLFLRDLETAHAMDVRRPDWDDDDHDNDPDLDDLSDANVSNDGNSSSSSSDDDKSRRDSMANSTNLPALLERLLQKANWSASKCAKVSRHLDEWLPPRACSRPKQFMVVLRDKVLLPWKKSELEAVATACRRVNQRHRVDPSTFVTAMRDALERYSGVAATRESPPGASHQSSGSSHSTALKPVVAKIYDAFLQAAQRNINGRELLERCDVGGSGTISWPEFSTVLRLIDCCLAPSDMATIQQALQSPSSCPYKSFFALLETYGAVSASSIVATSPRHHRSSPSMRHPSSHPHIPLTSSPLPHAAVHALPVAYTAPSPPAYNAVYPSHVVESELRAIFADALRSIDVAPIVTAFRQYDVKGCGFISLDGFHAAMRHGGIFLSPDVYTKLASQFAARFSDGIDYVQFCHVMGLQLPHVDGGGPPSSSSYGHRKVAPLQLPFPSEPSPRAGAITPTAVESWLQHGASEEDKRRFNDMYNAICQFKTKDLSPAQVPVLDSSDRPHDASCGTQGSARPPLQTPSAALSSRDTWTCPVCFRTQSLSNTACEICAAKHPTTRSTSHPDEFEVALQCSVCAFRNKRTASACRLCQTPLHPQHHASSKARSSAAPASPGGDGWLT